MEHNRESRKRLRPWLERMIISGECPGVVWENKEERTFRIPWRHFNNKDWMEKDSQIFLEWAKYTGKYKDGDHVEYPVWKTRLRCALKKIPEIKELPALHNLEDADPYRVYQFIDVPNMKKVSDIDSDSSPSPSSSASAVANSPAGMRDFLEDSSSPQPNHYDSSYGCSPSQVTAANTIPTVVFDDCANPYPVQYYSDINAQSPPNFLQPLIKMEHGFHFKTEEGSYGDVPELPNYGEYINFLGQTTTAQQNFSYTNIPVTASQANQPAVSQEVSSHIMSCNTGLESLKDGDLPSDLKSVESMDLCPMTVDSLNSLNSGFQKPQIPSTPSALKPGNVPAVEHSMQLTLSYGFPSQHILHETVKGKGCRLYCGSMEPDLKGTLMEEDIYGPKDLYQLDMPVVGQRPEIVDEQKAFITDLLKNTARGVLLTMENGDIYAERLCRTRVFVTDGISETKLLDRKRDKRTKVFDFNNTFKTAYENAQRGLSSEIPKTHFYLTFGQEIRKDRQFPMSRILIQVLVKHTEAARLVSNLTNINGNSFEPLVSSLDSHDKILVQFQNMALTKA